MKIVVWNLSLGVLLLEFVSNSYLNLVIYLAFIRVEESLNWLLFLGFLFVKGKFNYSLPNKLLIFLVCQGIGFGCAIVKDLIALEQGSSHMIGEDKTPKIRVGKITINK